WPSSTLKCARGIRGKELRNAHGLPFIRSGEVRKGGRIAVGAALAARPRPAYPETLDYFVSHALGDSLYPVGIGPAFRSCSKPQCLPVSIKRPACPLGALRFRLAATAKRKLQGERPADKLFVGIGSCQASRCRVGGTSERSEQV